MDMVMVLLCTFFVCLCAVSLWHQLAPRSLVVFVATVLPHHEAVELINYDGRSYYTVARPTKGSRNMVAPVYWFSQTGHCVLMPQGITSYASGSSYIYFWLPINAQKRMALLLTYDLPDFGHIARMKDRERFLAMYTTVHALRNKWGDA
jgi:hypothetical protein